MLEDAIMELALYNNYSETRNLIGQYIAVQDQAILHRALIYQRPDPARGIEDPLITFS